MDVPFPRGVFSGSHVNLSGCRVFGCLTWVQETLIDDCGEVEVELEMIFRSELRR